MPNQGRTAVREARRPVLAAILLLAVTALAASCTRPVAGAPLTSDEGVRKAMEQRFDSIIDKVETYLAEDRSAKVVQNWQSTINDKSAKERMESYYYGQPPTTLIKRGSVDMGTNVDLYHPGGSKYDYVLLGEKLKSMAPTSWVAVPAALYDNPLKHDCTLPSKIHICKIAGTIARTADESRTNISKIAYSHPDGSTSLLTNMTVEDFIDEGPISYPDNVKDQLSPPILDKLLSTRIDLDRNNKVKKLEVKGSIERAGKKFSVNLEHEILRQANTADFPPTPSGAELTTMNNEAKAEKFWDDVLSRYTKLRNG